VFGWKSKELNCESYRARMEDRLGDGAGFAGADPELDAHLRQCAECRDAFAAGAFAGELVRSACETTTPPVTGAFVTRVMAAIREEQNRLTVPGAIWRPIELLASRFALAAAVVLLGLSVYLVEFAPPFDMPPTSSPAEIGASLLEPPAQPANPDEVLTSLLETENGN
jgi:predicted anti-sigma-YlaC factor YlaD